MSNSAEFEFNAPQFLDFNVGLDDSDGADTFFDVESDEPTQKDENKENKSENLSAIRIKEEIISPPSTTDRPLRSPTIQIKTESQTPKKPNSPKVKSVKKEVQVSGKKRNIKQAVRRLSGINKPSVPVAKVGPFAPLAENLCDDLKKLTMRAKKRTHFEGIEIDIKEEKQHSMTTRTDEARKTPTIGLRTRVVNKDNGDGPNRKRKIVSGDCDAPSKYMAMAERILHFQKDTPPRFHTSKRRSSGIHGSRLKARQSYRPQRTVAVTPKLLTSMRSRPVDIPTQEAREEMVLEEMRRHQVKAMPLNEKILQPPKPIHKSGRQSTVPDPFHLTQVFKKPEPKTTDKEPFKFTAKPLPKAIFEKPVGIGPKQALPITIPESPAITKSARFQKPTRVPSLLNDNKISQQDLNSFGVACHLSIVKNTEVKPFSFEDRDRQMREKKEKKIKEILEAEKKAREFKANPVPSFVAPKENLRQTRNNHMDCSKSSIVSMTEDSQPTFKARSPKVLRKAPFKPNLDHAHSQPLDIQLHTERRLAERKGFEIKQLIKEEEFAITREQQEMERKEREMAEIARLRQETVHKAQPMPKFKPPPKSITSKIPLTEPQSPRFTRRTRVTNNE